MTESDLKQIQIIHDDVLEIKNVLKGYGRNKGLCEEFSELKLDYYRFKRNVFAVLAFDIGSGILGISAIKILGG